MSRRSVLFAELGSLKFKFQKQRITTREVAALFEPLRSPGRAADDFEQTGVGFQPMLGYERRVIRLPDLREQVVASAEKIVLRDLHFASDGRPIELQLAG